MRIPAGTERERYVKQTDGQADRRIYGRAYEHRRRASSGSIYSLDKRRHGDRLAAGLTEREAEEKNEGRGGERATEEESPRF